MVDGRRRLQPSNEPSRRRALGNRLGDGEDGEACGSRCHNFNGLLFCGQLLFDDDFDGHFFVLNEEGRHLGGASGIYHGVQGTKGVQFFLNCSIPTSMMCDAMELRLAWLFLPHVYIHLFQHLPLPS
jgi:hypothetical protein